MRDLLRALDGIAVPGPSPKAAPCRDFRAVLYALAKEEGGRHTPLFGGLRPGFMFGGREAEGELVPSGETGMVMPGECAAVEVRLAAPARMARGTRFTVREEGRAVGAGTVTELLE